MRRPTGPPAVPHQIAQPTLNNSNVSGGNNNSRPNGGSGYNASGSAGPGNVNRTSRVNPRPPMRDLPPRY